MNKLWFKTKRGHIIDLNFVSYFYENDHVANEVYAVLSDTTPTHMRIGMFDTKEEAQQYLDEIYQLLKHEQFNYLEAICADICTIATKLEEIKSIVKVKND